MKLIKTYEEYKGVNSNLISFLENVLSNNSLQEQSDLLNNLNSFLNEIENLKIKSDKLEIDEDNKTNLNDLRYLLVSCLFLLSDLIHFYNLNEYERFKMRAVNYINHNKRQDFLNS